LRVINQIYTNLINGGFKFHVKGKALYVSPDDLLTHEMRNLMKTHKKEFIALIHSLDGLGPQQAQYLNDIALLFGGEVELPAGYTDPTNNPLSKEEVELINEERKLNRAEYHRRLELFKKSDYSLATEPFRGKLTDPATVTSPARKAYLERLRSFRKQEDMISKGEAARWEALDKLKKKVDAEFTPRMIWEATQKNIARIRKAQARRKIKKQVKKAEKENEKRFDLGPCVPGVVWETPYEKKVEAIIKKRNKK